MKFRVVAIPLFAAICLATPSITSGEQAQRGRGYRPRDGGGGQTAERSGGDNHGGGERARTAGTNNTRAEERRAEARTADRGDDGQRSARPRDNGPRDTNRRNERPIIVTRNRPDININLGSGYRGQRYYAPVHYDRWARQYYRWSPISYAPWSLIYGSIGFSNYGYYGGIAPSTYHYGYNGYYGPGAYSPWQAGGYDVGGIRLRIRPRDAQVFVDGYYAGLVDDFDGTFQSLRLEAGGHRIEIHMPGFEDLELDVHVQPGRTITLDEQMRPRP